MFFPPSNPSIKYVCDFLLFYPSSCVVYGRLTNDPSVTCDECSDVTCHESVVVTE